MSAPLISVIIPCYNAEVYLEETIESVWAQTFTDYEIILIDDGSIDNTAQLIASLAQQRPTRIRYHLGPNQGPSAARNQGTSMAAGKYIQYLDADDLLTPDKFRIQLEAMTTTKADIAYGDWQKLLKTSDSRFVKGELFERVISEPETDLFTHFWCPPAVYLLRREIVAKVGLWRDNLPIIQDARFMFDCAFAGASFVYCAGLMAYYRIHSNDTVSRRNPQAFVKDCWQNALEVENAWEHKDGINKHRRLALLEAYSYIARASFANDQEIFEKAYNALERLQPGYIPSGPKYLALATRLIGYRRAEGMALKYRKLKNLVVSAAGE